MGLAAVLGGRGVGVGRLLDEVQVSSRAKRRLGWQGGGLCTTGIEKENLISVASVADAEYKVRCRVLFLFSVS